MRENRTYSLMRGRWKRSVGETYAGNGGYRQGPTWTPPRQRSTLLHYVFDLWVEHWRKRARGDVIVVRYADDIVLGFQYESDARRFWAALRGRLAKFGLELHPDKTRLLRFGTLVARHRAERGEGRPETFDFLGFTHICGKSRRGRFLLLRRTANTRVKATLKALKAKLMRRRHRPVPEQGAWLRSVLRGYFGYFAVPTNWRRVEQVRAQVIKYWFRALRRRSQRTRLNWVRMSVLVHRWIPPARILHPWPDVRFDARTRGRSPVR